MKLKNALFLLSTSIVLSTSAFADGSMASKGGAYVGFVGAWSKVDYDTDTAAYFTGGGTAAAVKSGGFGGRAYLGYLIPNNTGSNWLFGPEVGYSSYQHNVYTEQAGPYDSTTTESADGVDLLLNVTYTLTEHLNLAVKPGIQYASQKDETTDFTPPPQQSDLPPSASNSKIVPEVNFEINWQALANVPLFVGASYQYVFADSAVGTFERLCNGTQGGSSYASVTSRQMMGLNVEYTFN